MANILSDYLKSEEGMAGTRRRVQSVKHYGSANQYSGEAE